MITITRTPLRVSLFGGGTDYPDYFKRKKGAVVGFAINKYIYISAIPLTSHVEYKYKLGYSKVEMVNDIGHIEHPVVRALLHHYNYDAPSDFSIQSDLPANIGLGSSSSFTVGFVHLLSALQNIPRSKMEIAREAIFTEQTLLKENVGVQDQLHASFGGMNCFEFEKDKFKVIPINIKSAQMKCLTEWMVLVYSGIKRSASTTVAKQIQNMNASKIESELEYLYHLVGEAHDILENQDNPAEKIAALLHKSWQVKKKLSHSISSTALDIMYDECMKNGALGGKLCGAGGGGFLLMMVPPEKRQSFIQKLGHQYCLDVSIDVEGSSLLSVNQGYSKIINSGWAQKEASYSL